MNLAYVARIFMELSLFYHDKQKFIMKLSSVNQWCQLKPVISITLDRKQNMQSVAINLKTATESKKKYEIDIVRPKVKALLVLYNK